MLRASGVATLLIFVINKQSFGWTIQFVVSMSTLLGAVTVAGIAAIVAELTDVPKQAPADQPWIGFDPIPQIGLGGLELLGTRLPRAMDRRLPGRAPYFLTVLRSKPG